MIEQPGIWKKQDQVNWLCLYMREFAGAEDLRLIPILLSGYRSVRAMPLLHGQQQVLHNIRLIARRYCTLTMIRKAAVRYNEYYSKEKIDRRLFLINEKTLTFKPLHDLFPPEYYEARASLEKALPLTKHDMLIADISKPLFIEIPDAGKSHRYSIKELPAVPAPVLHEPNERKVSEITVTFDELRTEAVEMDALDGKHNRRKGNWASRLERILCQEQESDGVLRETESLTLNGLKHLIGLPGAGKTTLLMCLTRWLSKQGYRTALFFPSIEVCRQYLTALQFYGVKAGLLMGRSEKTRNAHAHKLAESIASGDPLHGFANTLDGAEYFATNCVLPSYTAAPEEGLLTTTTFCSSVLETKQGHANQDSNNSNNAESARYIQRLCPLWQRCGYHKSSRELAESDVILGHIASCDTKVPTHTTRTQLRYFELLRRDFDVVIFDEADKVQSWLDGQGVSQLILTGDSRSFNADLQRRQIQLAGEQNFPLGDPSFVGYAMSSTDFARSIHLLVNAIQLLDSERRETFEGLLLTPSRLINSLVSGERGKSKINSELEDVDSNFRRKDVICQLWESAAIHAFYNRQRGSALMPIGKGIDPDWIAGNLELDTAAVITLHKNLTDELRGWLTQETYRGLDEALQKIQELVETFIPLKDPLEIKQKIRLLVSVTFTILGYRRLVPHAEALREQGFAVSTNIENQCSDDLIKATTENILGSLSGVRFFLESKTEGNPHLVNVKLQYVVFTGSPRAFIYHLHEPEPGFTRTPHVILASATSYLEASPAFHVDVKPHYIVKSRGENQRFTQSRFCFMPIADKARSGYCLRYSGEASATVRLNNLKKMVDHLLQGGIEESLVGREIHQFDADKRLRKAAFVVNSYQHSRMLKQYIDHRYPADWSLKTVAVVDDVDEFGSSTGYVTPAQVEALGDDDSISIIIFPMGAIGRGTNIVFTQAPRELDAAIGTFYFLTRPHPSGDDLSLLISLAAQASETFNQADFSSVDSFDELYKHYNRARQRTYAKVGKLLRNPMISSRLGPLFEPFTANCGVELLQTIGRGMRNGCPVQCFFVDSAWAKNSALGDKSKPDTDTTSMLVQLTQILRKCVYHDDKHSAAIYRELYLPFLDPLERIEGLIVKTESSAYDPTQEEDYRAGPLIDEDLEAIVLP